MQAVSPGKNGRYVPRWDRRSGEDEEYPGQSVSAGKRTFLIFARYDTTPNRYLFSVKRKEAESAGRGYEVVEDDGWNKN